MHFLTIMVNTKTRGIIIGILLLLGVVGLFSSCYLTYIHYFPDEGDNGVCNVNDTTSCSNAILSKYGKVFGVPAGIWGIAWFLAFMFLSWKIKERPSVLRELISWNLIGTIFVLYFIFAEIKLGVICTFCTVVHVVIIIALVLTLILRKSR